MNILFSGGGTLGPVTPLLAMHETLRAEFPQAKFLWVGTVNGPEQTLVERQGIPCVTIASGKLRRYASLSNLIDVVRVGVGFLQALVLLEAEKPDMCISAGGFVSVPIHLAAHTLGIPTWIHAQDVRVGLAARLMARGATVVTTALEKNLSEFPKKKARWLGNPVRASMLSGNPDRGRERFHISGNLPVVFVTGGGTGSERINALVTESVEQLAGVCEIIHLSGIERSQEDIDRAAALFPHYHAYQFFTDEMKDAYALADVVVSRAGFGTVSEAAALGRAAILIPKPGHQEDNAKFLDDAGAIISLDERGATGNELAISIKELLGDPDRRRAMGQKLQSLLPAALPKDIIEIVRRVISKR